MVHVDTAHDAAPELEQRNMRCGIIHGAFFQMATAFADPHAVVPLFLAGFTESRTLIGFIVSLVTAFTVVPQLKVARIMRRRPRSARPFMLAGIWTRCGVWGIIALIAITCSRGTIWVLIVFAGLVTVYSLGGGVAVLPFRQVISETISPERRSTFFGQRLLTGGLLAVMAGAIVKAVLGNENLIWPRNYGILFALSFASLAAAYTAMSGLRVPDREVVPLSTPPPSLRSELSDVWRVYPILKRLIIVRLLSGGLPLVLPFLTLYATKEIGISLRWVGIFIVAHKCGAVLGNLGWMPLGNKFGTRLVIFSGLGMSAAGLTAIAVSQSAAALTTAFALVGGSMSATVVGFSGYILELGNADTRPLLNAIEGTLLFPLYFMPLFGGLVADRFGYRVLVLAGIVLVAAACVTAAVTLCEPRRKDPACGPYAGL